MKRGSMTTQLFSLPILAMMFASASVGCSDGFLDIFAGNETRSHEVKPAHARGVEVQVDEGVYGEALLVTVTGDGADLHVKASCQVGSQLVYEETLPVSGGEAVLQPGPTPVWEATGRQTADCVAEAGAFHKNGRWSAADAQAFVVRGEGATATPDPDPCGDGVCGDGEDCTTCDADCGSCPVGPVCGDGSCDSPEDCGSCAQDCGTCPAATAGGIWLSQGELMQLPTSGNAWTNIVAQADADCGTPDLSNQDEETNVCIMATALAAARTGNTDYVRQVVDAIRSIVNSGTYVGRALALGRKLEAYVIAADLIGLVDREPSLDASFRSKLIELRTTPTDSGPGNLIECHEVRPNNWGTHCGASRLAVALYLGDDVEVARVAQVFRGYLGDRGAYSDLSEPGFRYGSDLSWQCDASKPVGINPHGCLKNGHHIGGILPEEQRRCGSFQWPPCESVYQWSGLQGPLAQAWMLHRAGYPAFDWEDQALLRAFHFLHDVMGFVAEGDDQWQPYLMNHVYGTNFPTVSPARPGKNVGWTDWTHP